MSMWSNRITRLLTGSPLIDGHNDLPDALRVLAGEAVSPAALEKFALDRHQPLTRTDLPRLAAGRVGAQFWSVYVPGDLPPAAAVVRTLQQIDLVREMHRRFPDRLELVTTAGGLESAFRAGRIAGLIGAEGGHSICDSLAVLRMLYELGVRYLTLTHNQNAGWADSATDVPRVGGLSDFGREVVAEMNRIGMLVDLSHVADTTMRAALDATRAPVIFSHSSARAICGHPRNVPDDVLARLPGNGGVCMVTFVPAFLSAERWAWERHRTGPVPPVTVEHVADHVEHVREVAGVEHVGLGGDFDGCGEMPAGLDDVTGYPRLFGELAARRWSDAELAALAGGNVLRVLRTAESGQSQPKPARHDVSSSFSRTPRA
ncbi:dipeptidase [Actinoplanes couchii]|uniref:dipeptidase n=1 Tax=Actinoplanes couchii TaxID=403638 RepID=UPI001EF1B4B3|nr:dipeptidase [Actinoplanes couchii]MDR6325870.1 membrane dipeptidase [Actinoplanes couchii]